MGIERFFTDSRTLHRFTQGPLALHFNDFCRWMECQGYRRDNSRRCLSKLSHFSIYLARFRDITDFATISPQYRISLITHYSTKYKKKFLLRRKIFNAINRFLHYLKDRGYEVLPLQARQPFELLVDEYGRWMKEVRNAADGTLQLRMRYVSVFLKHIGSATTVKSLSTLSIKRIQSFFISYAHEHGRASRRSMQSALRTFLRFCHARQYMAYDLSAGVPTIRTYKHATLPHTLSDNQAQRVLSRIDRKTPVGMRDYALIQLLYGVRGIQLRKLRLADILWERNQIRFGAVKNGKEILMPLTQPVGESILTYVRYARPSVPYPEVFLTMRAPFRPLRRSTNLSQIVAYAFQKTNTPSQRFGSHLFRHHFASRMLQNGYPLKDIADMLGHRCIQTTAIYTKIDFTALQDVPLPWPQEKL